MERLAWSDLAVFNLTSAHPGNAVAQSTTLTEVASGSISFHGGADLACLKTLRLLTEFLRQRTCELRATIAEVTT